MSTVFTVDYFIKKFEAIPEEKWCVKAFNSGDQCCAYGHCGLRDDYVNNAEGDALEDLFRYHLIQRVEWVNDHISDRFPQPTPKQRILAALREIKAKEAK